MGTRLDPNLDAVIEALPSHFDISVQNTTKFEVQKTTLGRTSLCIRPLNHLVSLPLQTRRRLFAPLYKNQAWSEQSDSPIRQVVREATLFMTAKYGEDTALRWRDEMYESMLSLFVAEGVQGLFFNKNGAFRIREIGDGNRYEYSESLDFNFLNGWECLATRTVQYGEKPPLFSEGSETTWNCRPEFQSVFEGAKKLYLSNLSRSVSGMTDFFFWHDQPLKNFPESFVRAAVKDAESTFDVRSENRSFAVLLLSINGEGLERLDTLERLGLQRCDGQVRVMFSPGTHELAGDSEIKLRGIEDLDGSQLESAFFQRIEALNLHDSPLFDCEPTVLMHQGTQDAQDRSFVSISFPCWNGTWRSSHQIDGEHIMA